ncbi:hypothetical protein LTR37_016145 [Vermiconidia calcicola]|uniref:Uncharacterized protein n=1 Tax=Vermiconidia calcicola TaxID=1690605 RepID=A0ACC3MNX4_9PEZI|nr:hypothetical protein LTR37_016145 [Vermiconidia calcicola]
MPKRKRNDAPAAEDEPTANDGASKRPKRGRKDEVDESSKKTTATQDQSVQVFTVSSSKGKDIACERRSATDNTPALIFTHGAGGGLSNPATALFADGFAEVSPVTMFKGNMNLKARVNSFQAVIGHEEAQASALGGRSMGARAAVLTAQESEAQTKALVLASYPMVGASKGDSREQILLDLPEGIDVLFISGSKDSMCDLKHLHKVVKKMKARSWICEVTDADHGMGLKPKVGEEPMRKHMGKLAAQWLLDRDEGKRYCTISWDKDEGEVTLSGWQKDAG